MDSRPSWQEQEINRRLEEESRERRKDAEEGKGGLLHPMYSGLTLRWFAFMEELGKPLSCRKSLLKDPMSPKNARKLIPSLFIASFDGDSRNISFSLKITTKMII